MRACFSAGTRSDEVFQHLSGDCCRVPDADRGPLPTGRAVPQQYARGRRHAVESRTARDARTARTQRLRRLTFSAVVNIGANPAGNVGTPTKFGCGDLLWIGLPRKFY